MTVLEHAILGLQHVVDAPPRHTVWRALVQHRMAGVRDALAAEEARGGDAWLSARETQLLRERDALLRRLVDLGPRVEVEPDLEGLRRDLHRVLTDLERHCQRLNDLVYDAVSLDLGGSE